MFKRLRWTVFGALIGAGGSVWARRRVRRAVQRYLPQNLRTDARRRLSIARDDWRAAIDEGRAAMEEREAELRTHFADRLIAEPPRRGRIIEAGSPPATPLPGLPPATPPASLPPDSLDPDSLSPDSLQSATRLPDPPPDSPPAGPRPGPVRHRLVRVTRQRRSDGPGERPIRAR